MKREYNKGADRKSEQLNIRVTPEQKKLLQQIAKTIGWGAVIGMIAGLVEEERKENQA